LISHEITYDTDMNKGTSPRCPPFERSGGKISRHISALRRPWYYLWCCNV